MTPRSIRELAAVRFALCVLALCVLAPAAQAQVWPPGPSAPPGQTYKSQICTRLEAQLATIDRGGADPARAEQVRRYEETANRQQLELDRTVAQARRAGCEGSGFFLFGGGQGPQCGELNAQIQRMRANLNRILNDLQRLRGSRIDGGEQRGAILAALADNDCGPQYRQASKPRGLFEQLFGATTTPGEPGSTPETPGGAYRTICVRTCDGFYFPISYATNPQRFREDEKTCQRMCPAAEAILFSHKNPGEEVAQATSISGQLYSALPNAFRYRQEFNPACSCKRPGQTWAQAMGEDPTVERGDIVVTEEKAKTLSLPRPELRGAKDPRRGPQPPAGAKQPPAPAPAAETPEPGKRAVRTIGPTFYPVR